jgi:ElaB/YqjD/DUF883 family membrane-anchored ribosome-binding protein
MITSKPIEAANRTADQAARAADYAITTNQRGVDELTDPVSGTVEDSINAVRPTLRRAADQASALAHRGMDAVREGSGHLREQARHASDRTISYIKAEPVKSVLIAAATGAALMALVSLISRSHARD